jgi:hypothetical protein
MVSEDYALNFLLIIQGALLDPGQDLIGVA